MRILHTSDWHLGRSFHGEDLLVAQAAFVDHLLETVELASVDLVVLAGDVYDRALPPVDAVALADEAFTRLASSRARLMVTSGNHDSARRLGFNARLVDHAGVHLRTDPSSVGTPVMLADEHGPVAVYGVPYLEPDVVRLGWGLSSRSHEAVTAHALGRVRDDLSARPRTTRSVVVAHAFVSGGVPSESERDISVGGVSVVPLELFDGFTYVALGHLHGRARLAEAVRYSGSPLAYSFSESDHVKGSWLVDLDAAGVAATEFVEAPVPRPLVRLSGTLESLLSSPRHAAHERSWVEVTLTDVERPRQPMQRLQARFPHALSLRFAPAGGAVERPRTPTAGRSAHQISLDFVEHVRGSAATPAESALLRTALECCPEDTDLAAEHRAEAAAAAR